MMKPQQALTLLTLAGASTLALAHGGSDAGAHHGLAEGLIHPFTGLDHLLALLAVGLWSAGSARRAWIAPLSFLLMLLAGALLRLPAPEPLLALSLVVLGALLLAPRRAPAALALPLIAAFALLHGAAHGRELMGGATALGGMLLGSAVLQGLGFGLGLALARISGWLPRAAGASIALSGLALLA